MQINYLQRIDRTRRRSSGIGSWCIPRILPCPSWLQLQFQKDECFKMHIRTSSSGTRQRKWTEINDVVEKHWKNRLRKLAGDSKYFCHFKNQAEYIIIGNVERDIPLSTVNSSFRFIEIYRTWFAPQIFYLCGIILEYSAQNFYFSAYWWKIMSCDRCGEYMRICRH